MRPRASVRSSFAKGVPLEPLIYGAGHELGRRAGTESALLAVALGKACELARDLRQMEQFLVPRVITFGKSSGNDLETAWFSMVIRHIACRTR